MRIDPIAQELNSAIKSGNPHLIGMLSKTGRRLYFPKSILAQTAEARQKAYDKFNATIGIATYDRHTLCLPSLMERVSGIRPSDALTYAPPMGIFALRQMWRDGMYEKNPSLSGKHVSMPVVTNGITHGISVFSDMFVDPDDVVIFPDKMWGNNNLIMSVRGDARITHYPMFSTDGEFNLEGFEAKIRQEAVNNQKISVFLNFPNNPTGYTLNESEAEGITRILTKVAQEGTNVIAVTDDAYFGLCYDDEAIKESLFARLCDCHSRILAVKLDGVTAELFAWGLRVGFITYGTVVDGDRPAFYDALERKTAGNIRGSVSSAGHLNQTIVLNALKSPDLRKERAEKIDILRQRAIKVREIVTDSKYQAAWEMYPFNSGYFVCLRLKTVNAERLRSHLLDEYKVGTISVGETDIRIAFSTIDEENIPEFFESLYKAIKDLE